jgi:hypothetical protein
MRVNPNHNQGSRYLLLDCLLIQGRDAEVEKLLRRYPDDGAALGSGRRRSPDSGARDSEKARKALVRASRGNAYVCKYLLGRKNAPAHASRSHQLRRRGPSDRLCRSQRRSGLGRRAGRRAPSTGWREYCAELARCGSRA